MSLSTEQMMKEIRETTETIQSHFSTLDDQERANLRSHLHDWVEGFNIAAQIFTQAIEEDDGALALVAHFMIDELFLGSDFKLVFSGFFSESIIQASHDDEFYNATKARFATEFKRLAPHLTIPALDN